jgi:hypothetical protein
LSTKKFLSNIPVSAAGEVAAFALRFGGDVAAATGLAAVVVAGDMAAVEGVMPDAGESPGAVTGAFAAGLVAGFVAGLVAGFEAGAAAAGAAGPLGGAVAAAGGGGGTWPNEVNAIVTEQRLAISSVFIG